MAHSGTPPSPELQIYRPQLNTILSITHRAAGVALAVGTLLLVYWVVAAAAGPEAYAGAQRCIGSWLGRLALLGWTAALFYHLCHGNRHLGWGGGYCVEAQTPHAPGHPRPRRPPILTRPA